MRFSILPFVTFGLATAAAAPRSVTVTYDEVYDSRGRSLDTVACSDGENGLETRYGFRTLGELPTFPNIGGAFSIAGYNDVDCGACYTVTYRDKTILVTAIDAAPDGFNIGLKAMNKLTNNQAVHLGKVQATAKRVGIKRCGL